MSTHQIVVDWLEMEISKEMCARVCVHSANPYLAGRWLRRQVKVMVVGGMKRPDCK